MHLSRYHGCADEQNLQDLEEYTTRRYPRVRWILAHCARSFTYWPIRQAIDRLRSLPNIWYDTSAVTDVMPHATLFKKEDHRRILFGTDDMVANAFHGKYITMGRFWYQMETPEVAKKPEIHTDSRPVLSIYDQLLAMKLAAELAELTRQQIEDIFYNNARDAFGLEPAAAAGTARD
jgi:predicted TIM-barrel fold metal-dependent hydrolase